MENIIFYRMFRAQNIKHMRSYIIIVQSFATLLRTIIKVLAVVCDNNVSINQKDKFFFYSLLIPLLS